MQAERTCMCGCGGQTNPGRSYLKGHNSKSKYRDQPAYRVDAKGCWVWARCIRKDNGYGAIYHGGAYCLAHRVYYERFNGPVPAGLDLDHLCRNRACVNPDHLEPVTPAENARRGEGTKLNWESVRAIRASTLPRRVLAEKYDVTYGNISMILWNKNWRDDPEVDS